MILGGLIGSAVGNKLSDSNGAGSAGAVAGALLGRERAKQTAKAGDIVGYRQQEICQTNRIVEEEVIEKIVGYRCLLYTSPSPRDATLSRMPSSA